MTGRTASGPRAVLRAVLLSSAGIALLLAGCGSDDEPVVRTAAADDPATVLCRRLETPDRQTCEGSFFQCRAEVDEIVDDIDAGKDPDPRTISVRYARSYWSDWDSDARAAARRGCRGALER